MSMFSAEVSARFWGKVDTYLGNRCWIWAGCLNRQGYGQIRIVIRRGKSKAFLAHRVSWMLANGEIQPGMFVLHKCDNPKCVRLDHLYLGTQADNLRDMASKGRHVGTRGKRWHEMGRHTGNKLNRSQADIIRSAEGSRKEIAKRFNINPSMVSKIKKGTHWPESF